MAKLELRELGNTGLKLSSVGFGASLLGNVFGNVSEKDAIDTVREAFNLGINFFDTSPYYGDTLSETMLGNALKPLEFHEINLLYPQNVVGMVLVLILVLRELQRVLMKVCQD
ncbi:hypothetical protein MKX01_037156 [Papaver californicum]|nr:hypothetical protein MKX01_037156 [Papaver californicum]